MSLEQPNNDVFGLLVDEKKINHCKDIVGPFWHLKIKNACG
jgi:hypothetical protein